MTEQEITLIVGNLQGTMTQVLDRVNSIDNKLDERPCIQHGQRIEVIEHWQQSCQNTNSSKQIESFKADKSLRNSIIIGILTLFTGVTGTLITLYLTNIIGH